MSSPLCAHPGALPRAPGAHGSPPAPATPSPAGAPRVEGTDGIDSTDGAGAASAIPTVGQELRRIYAHLVFLR